MNGRFECANYKLTKALRLVQRCTDLDTRSDIHRRWAILHLSLAQRPDGSFTPSGLHSAAESAARAMGDARGELCVARARLAHGLVAIRNGAGAEAAQAARAALRILDPKERPHDYASALSILVSALTRGERADREAASHHLAQLRQLLPPRSPALRARLLWAEALLHIPNRRRKARARRLLDQARRTFVRLGMKAEAVAVTAELTRIHPEGAVAEFCAELSAILECGPLQDLVERLRASSLIGRVKAADHLRAAAQAPGLLPSAV